MRRVLSITLFCLACEVIDPEMEQSWQGTFSLALLPGYSAFRGEVNLTDYGVVIFSYKLPEDVAYTEAVDKLGAHLRRQQPCYAATSMGSIELQLRCPEAHVPGEIRAVARSDGRIFVMCMSAVPPSASRYQEFVEALHEACDC